eukprot:3752957-Ditylum_brightwellii.AAC.1
MVKIENGNTKPEAVGSMEKSKNAGGGMNKKFEGRWSEQLGYVFDTDPRNSNRFSIVQEERARYFGANFDHGDNIAFG